MHEWVNRITSRWPVAFLFPGLDQPLFALMRTVVTYNSFLWRAKVQLCCLSEDHHASNSKVKAVLGEEEFTQDGKQPVWKNSFGEGAESNWVFLFWSSPCTPRSQVLQSHVGAHPLCCWVQTLAICLYPIFPIEGISFKSSLIVNKSRKACQNKPPGTTLSW